MPQPKSRKIAILGYRSVGESACMTSSCWENIFGVLRRDAGAKRRRPSALVWSEGFTPTLIVGDRFSSGETWPGRFILPEAARHVPKADHFLPFRPVRLPPTCLIGGGLRAEARAAAFDALLSFYLMACGSEEAQLARAESTLVTARWHALMAQLEAQSACQHWTTAMLERRLKNPI